MSNIDLSRVPVSALRKATLSILSSALNRHKVIPCEEGLPRDWRGLAHLIGLTGGETSRIGASSDPTAELIKQWGPQGSVEKLQQFLGVIDRFDVLDDSQPFIEKDVEIYNERASIPSRPDTASNISDSVILTVDDVVRLEQGLDPQIYDAYLLFAEEDIDFASKIVDTMEREYQMKFCIRDRDLVGGIAFEHEAIMKLIAERCRRLLVIVTPNFLRSSANKFFVTFAQALGIDQRQRKVIPILYEKCDLPPELSYYFLLDYSRAGVLWNFWDKLRDSILTPDVKSATRSSPWMTKLKMESPPQEPKIDIPVPASPVASPATKNFPSPSTSKKPILEAISTSIINLMSTNKEKIKNKQGKKNKEAKKSDSGYQSGENKSTRLFKSKKKAEALLS